MRIGFVGAGKVGFTLGKYMAERNVCVSGYYSRNGESAKEASDFTHTRYYETLEELSKASDALFLTVPDGAVETVWNSLKRYSISGKFICHCSGVMTSAVFSEIDRTGAFGYSIHPLFAVSSKLHSYQEISKAYFTVEGPEEHLDFWRGFFEKLGNPVRVLRPEQKILYHAAAVFSSNLVLGLYETGVRLLMDCGFDRESGEKALAPLFVNNCLAAAGKGAMDALTGPVERADTGTVEKHLQALSGLTRKLYTDASLALLPLAKQKTPGRDYDALTRLLERNGEEDEEHSSNL